MTEMIETIVALNLFLFIVSINRSANKSYVRKTSLFLLIASKFCHTSKSIKFQLYQLSTISKRLMFLSKKKFTLTFLACYSLFLCPPRT